jgi:hypothetical protein
MKCTNTPAVQYFLVVPEVGIRISATRMMIEEQRFGTDADALVNIMRNGVQNSKVVTQILTQLHTSNEGEIRL